MSDRFLLTALLALCLLTSACSQRERPVDAGVRDGILLVGNGTEPATLDPHLAVGVTEHEILRALFEGLVTRDGRDLSVRPAVAQSWTISDDGKVYTFALDPRARWSNGDPVTASDFLFSFERMLNPRLGSSYAKMLHPLEGAAAYNRGEITDFGSVGVRVIDPQTLELRLHEPLAYFLDLLAHGAWYPVHPPSVLAAGDRYDRLSRWTRPGKLVGNGPFQLSEWRLNAVVEVTRNRYFREAESTRLNAIRFFPIASMDTEERAFRSGFLHITHTIPPHRIDWYQSNRADAIHFDTYLGTYYYTLNVRQPPLDDPRVRLALAMSIDRQAIVDTILRAGQKPAFHFTPPNTAGYTSPYQQTFDPEAARQLLAEAGFADGAGFPEVEVLFNTSEAHREIAVAIQQMWRRELGIRVRLHNEEWKVYLDSRRAGRFEILRAGWIGDYNDPSTFLELFTRASGNNPSGWSHDDYEKWLASARSSRDPDERKRLFGKAETLLLQEAPVIPLYFYVRSTLIDERVRGRHANVLDFHPWQDIYFDQAQASPPAVPEYAERDWLRSRIVAPTILSGPAVCLRTRGNDATELPFVSESNRSHLHLSAALFQRLVSHKSRHGATLLTTGRPHPNMREETGKVGTTGPVVRRVLANRRHPNPCGHAGRMSLPVSANPPTSLARSLTQRSAEP
jgi:oligopeptide transport system substrate-binding protein